MEIPMPMRALSLIVLILSLVILSGCSQSEANLPYTNISSQELASLKAEGVPVFDIRRPEEWRQTGIVEGSRKLTAVDGSGRLSGDFLPTFTAEVSKDQPVILICRTGNRTSALAKYLGEQAGYSKIYNVRNGITGWIGEKNPVAAAN
jgi:rhodanese-related sulfurtransferase